MTTSRRLHWSGILVVGLVLGLVLGAITGPVANGATARDVSTSSPFMRTFDSLNGPARAVIWIPCCGAWFSQETLAASRPAYAQFDIAAPYFDPVTGKRAPNSEGHALGVPTWRKLGYRVVVSSYRDTTGRFGPQPPGISVTDALAQYDRIRGENPGLKVCAVGRSATGHVPLMVAAIKGRDFDPNDSGPDCIATEGSPADLSSLPARTLPLARQAFGEQGLRDNSPLFRADAIRSSVLMVSCTTDTVVPPDNSQSIVPELRIYRPSKPGQIVLGWNIPSVPADATHPQNCTHGSRLSRTQLDQYRAGMLAFIEASPKIHT